MSKPYLSPSLLMWSVTLLMSALSTFPSLAREYSLDYWSLPHLLQELRQATQRDHQLDEGWDRVLRCRKQRNELVNGLIDGRVSLPEAVAGLAPLDREVPGVATRDTLFPGRCEEERVARHLFYLVKVELNERKTDSVALLTRLEGELQTMLAANQ